MDRHELPAAMRDAGISIENAMFAQHLKAPVSAETHSLRSSFAVSEAEQDMDEDLISPADDAARLARYASRGRELQGTRSYQRLTLAENFSGNYGASGTVMGVSEQLRRKIKESWGSVSQLLQEWDSDGDGEISKAEFAKGMVAMGINLSSYEVDEVFSVCTTVTAAARSTSPSSTASCARGTTTSSTRRCTRYPRCANAPPGRSGTCSARPATISTHGPGGSG